MSTSSLSKLKPYRFRILAVFLLCVFLTVTWFTFHQPPQHSENLHVSLRTQLKELIQKTLSEKEPDASNVQFHRIWTEPTRQKNTITAQFEYSYDQQGTSVQISGAALIIKQNMQSQDYELWVVHSIRTDNWSIDFQEPVVLFSDKEYQTTESESSPVEKNDSVESVVPEKVVPGETAPEETTSKEEVSGKEMPKEKVAPSDAASAESKEITPSGEVNEKSKEAQSATATTNTESGEKKESSEENTTKTDKKSSDTEPSASDNVNQ